MNIRARVLVAVLGVTTLLGGFAPSAHALFGKHGSKAPKVQRMKKNANTYDYLKPKKQKKPTGYYRSTLTGDMVYGKKK